MKTVKCVIVGESGIGKTYLLYTYCGKLYPGGWVAEIKQYCPSVPVLLVGTNSDLRDNQQVLEKLRKQNQTTVTEAEGAALAKKIKAVKYLECTSINQEGLEEVFDEAARAYLSYLQNSTKKSCVLL